MKPTAKRKIGQAPTVVVIGGPNDAGKTTSEDRKERRALSTPAVKRALKAAALKSNKLGVALGVAMPIGKPQDKPRTTVLRNNKP